MHSRLILVAWANLLIYAGAFAQSISHVTVRTRAENNRNATVWYRVPENYREIAGRRVGCVCACRKGWCAGGHERIFRFRARSSHREMEFPYGRPFGYGHTWGYENWGDGVIRRAE